MKKIKNLGEMRGLGVIRTMNQMTVIVMMMTAMTTGATQRGAIQTVMVMNTMIAIFAHNGG